MTIGGILLYALLIRILWVMARHADRRCKRGRAVSAPSVSAALASWLRRRAAARRAARQAFAAVPSRRLRDYLDGSEAPTAIWAFLAGRAARRRLRFILKMRREMAIAVYEAQSALSPGTPRVPHAGAHGRVTAWPAEELLEAPAPSRPVTSPVVHMLGGAGQVRQRRWEGYGYTVVPPEFGHPLGVPCDMCVEAAMRKLDAMVAGALGIPPAMLRVACERHDFMTVSWGPSPGQAERGAEPADAVPRSFPIADAAELAEAERLCRPGTGQPAQVGFGNPLGPDWRDTLPQRAPRMGFLDE